MPNPNLSPQIGSASKHTKTKEASESYKKNMLRIDIAAKIHQGVSAELFEYLDESRNLLSKDLIKAFETSLKRIKKTDTITGAQAILKVLFDEVHEAALKLRDTEQQRMLNVALKIAKLKEKKTLIGIVKKTRISY